MTSEHNKAIVRRFSGTFTGNDQAAFNELLAPDLGDGDRTYHNTQR